MAYKTKDSRAMRKLINYYYNSRGNRLSNIYLVKGYLITPTLVDSPIEVDFKTFIRIINGQI